MSEGGVTARRPTVSSKVATAMGLHPSLEARLRSLVVWGI